MPHGCSCRRLLDWLEPEYQPHIGISPDERPLCADKNRSSVHDSWINDISHRNQTASAISSPGGSLVSSLTRKSRVETREMYVSGDYYFHTELREPEQLDSECQTAVRSVTHKMRLFGHTHYVNAIALLHDLFEMLGKVLSDETSKTHKLEKRCKAVARAIKSWRNPPWPCPPTPELPARAIADALVEGYLSTNETFLRILHIPSFRRDYEAVWRDDAKPDPVFLVQLKLVMAIGARVYDDTYSMRQSATRWVYEGHTWISAPEFKARLGIPSIQISLLLLLAREATGVGEDMIWANSGFTLRIAMYMGLHRDPAGLGPRTITPLVAEMRRRLWNTTLESLLQSSLNMGGPPLINLDEFDTEPPGNFDDEQLTGENPISKPADQFTQSSLAVALHATLPQRLAIVKYLNGLSSRSTFAETLKLDSELRASYKILSHTIQGYNFKSPSDFELRSLNIVLQQYFLTLHLPFLAPALEETALAFSRRVVIESGLRIWRSAFRDPISPSTTIPPSTTTTTTTTSAAADPNTIDLLARTATAGSGFFRNLSIKTFVAVAIELRTLLRDETESLRLLHPAGAVDVRPDLVQALREFSEWAWRGMETGETNTKAYLSSCIVNAQIDALRRGVSEGEMEAAMVRAAEQAEERCLALLEGWRGAAGEGRGGGGVGVGGGGGLTPLGVGEWGMEDWDYTMSDFLTDSARTEPYSWVFQ
ncbi:hypothetical protein N0V88_000174 [Collariella sp. IMI 366227]|nr:hypothetical protein N0V88_000174 [Collariella sp. IMI 366227]